MATMMMILLVELNMANRKYGFKESSINCFTEIGISSRLRGRESCSSFSGISVLITAAIHLDAPRIFTPYSSSLARTSPSGTFPFTKSFKKISLRIGRLF